MAKQTLSWLTSWLDFHPKPASFEYTPLTERQIRLLQLHPASKEEDQLRGELIIADLGDLPPPRPRNTPGPIEPIDCEKHVCFEAISYVWGDAAFTESLVTSKGSIPITVSLASILRRLRDEKQSRLYWADAVCINQFDVQEKEVQISLMGAIYTSAVRVLCDLGEETERVSLVLDAMSRYWRRNIRHGMLMSQGGLPHLSGENTAKVMGVSLPTDEEADAIEEVEVQKWSAHFMELASSPWFRRLWVVQEFVLGREVILLFGRRRVSWGELWAGMMSYNGVEWPWYSTEYTLAALLDLLIPYQSMCIIRACRLVDFDTPHGHEFGEAVKVLGSVEDLNQAFSLPMCLIMFCSAFCTIPRDRYFAILGLVDEDGKERPRELRPDYTSPMREITMRFWRYALQLASGGELIITAGIPGRAATYPSWLRDITAGSPWDHIWILGPAGEASHKAGGSCSWSAKFFDDDPVRMFLRGYHLDDITETLPFEPKETFALETMTRRLDKTFAFFNTGLYTIECNADMKYPLTGEHLHEAAWKTVCNYNKQDTVAPYDKRFEELFRMGVGVPMVATSDTIEGEDTAAKIANVYKTKMVGLTDLATRNYTTWGLRICKTRKGFFANLPVEARVGDSVWILAGCRLPGVLRPSASHPGSFEFVGGGYVHGVMNGEALEMPGFKWKGVSVR
ncbi:hypothetical protein DL764_003421 [Monosporascus ibericus]|uniref:Heterokaryon incompatibility domain-containing protein n=1 Tax=Monosporascus ibericus TaxID=155417 RepID=A0A4Q4THG0_9PEZI|nr:hypothetical protein DL764_003421 [Monosporascus ibericus]